MIDLLALADEASTVSDSPWSVLSYILVGVAGGGLTKIVDVISNKGVRKASNSESYANVSESILNQAQDLMNDMKHEILKLQILVSVLEEEVVNLGGSPERLRVEVARRIKQLDDGV